MQRRGLNPIVFVKLPGAVVKGVDEQCAHAGVLCHRHGTIDGILQHGGAKLLLVGIPVLLWTMLPIYHLFLFAISPKD